MRTLYYITRTRPLPGSGGGTIVRHRAVSLLREHFPVVVVSIGERSDSLEMEQLFPYKGNYAFERVKQATGFQADYLSMWAKIAFQELKNVVTREDILFATTGGELGTLELGAALKKATGARLVINYQDPIIYTSMMNRWNGVQSRIPNINRDKYEYRFINEADYIVCSSAEHRERLLHTYTLDASRIMVNYFGYAQEREKRAAIQPGKPLRIAYAGVFGGTQSPELLAELAVSVNGVEAVFIGDHTAYAPLDKYRGFLEIVFKGEMSYEDCNMYLARHADVGFVSLKEPAFGACVPSKIYEYINLQLPILGALPEGDAISVIRDNGFGFAERYDNIAALRERIERMKDEATYMGFVRNLEAHREEWSMEHRIIEVVDILNNL